MTAAATLHPIGIADLPDGAHACADCGLPVTGGPTEEVRTSQPVQAGPDTFVDTVTVDEFGLCDSCAARRAEARAIVDALPALRRYGDPRILADRLMYVLVALDALERGHPDEWTPGLVASALARLEAVGAQFRWARRFSPVRVTGAKPGTAASSPWLYASAEVWDTARESEAQWMLDRLPLIPIPCPTGGCAVCGISSWLGTRGREWAIWHATPTGGRYTGRHLCPACNTYRGDVLGGPSMISAAVVDFLDPDRQMRRRRGFLEPWVEGVPMWCDSGAPASSTRWGWIDLTRTRAELQTGYW